MYFQRTSTNSAKGDGRTDDKAIIKSIADKPLVAVQFIRMDLPAFFNMGFDERLQRVLVLVRNDLGDNIAVTFHHAKNDMLGVGGELWVSDAPDLPNHSLLRCYMAAAQANGIPLTDDFCAGDPEGAGWTQATIKNGMRCSSADALAWPPPVGICAKHVGGLRADSDTRRIRVSTQRRGHHRGVGDSQALKPTDPQVRRHDRHRIAAKAASSGIMKVSRDRISQECLDLRICIDLQSGRPLGSDDRADVVPPDVARHDVSPELHTADQGLDVCPLLHEIAIDLGLVEHRLRSWPNRPLPVYMV
jgi:choline dehydrogenase-like flavoprotein